jgi:hypothetical protein
MQSCSSLSLAPIVDPTGISIHIVPQQISSSSERFLFGFLARRIASCAKRSFSGMIVNAASYGALNGPLFWLDCAKEKLHTATSHDHVLDIFLGVSDDRHD